MCGLAVKEARMEGSYGRVENSLMRSFMRIGKWLNPSSTWAVTPFETLVRRGGCFVYEPSFAPYVKRRFIARNFEYIPCLAASENGRCTADC
jgi:hypothetical protein